MAVVPPFVIDYLFLELAALGGQKPPVRLQTTGGKMKSVMKSVVTVLFLLLIGMAASALAQGGSVEKGKALVADKKCALCHKEGEPGKPVLGKPMEMVAGGKTDVFLKEAITNPKKAIDPKTKMPEYKFTDAELQDVIAYLKSLAKH
jgi:mono/diheme cytochrome c family protein